MKKILHVIKLVVIVLWILYSLFQLNTFLDVAGNLNALPFAVGAWLFNTLIGLFFLLRYLKKKL